MITTFDILPSVEYVYNVDKIVPLGNMDAYDFRLNLLSKSIYAANTIKALQADPVFIGILGGVTGRYTKHHMDKSKIKSDIIWSELQTPHKIIVCDKDPNQQITITKQTGQISQIEIKKLEQKLRKYMDRTATLLVEGKLYDGISATMYRQLIEETKKYHIKTIISACDEEILSEVVGSRESVPYGIMFTTEQLHKMGIETTHIDELTSQLTKYLDQGVHYIAVDLQKQGGLLLSKNKFCYIEPLVEFVEPWTLASSAAFLGALAVGIDRKYEQEKIAKLVMASALAVQQYKEEYSKNHIDQLFKKVKVRERKNQYLHTTKSTI